MEKETLKLADELIEGKSLEMTASEEECEEVVSYIESKGIKTYSWLDAGDAVIEREDIEKVKYDFPKGTLLHNEEEIEWEIQPYSDKELELNFPKYGKIRLHKIGIDHMKMLGIVIDTGKVLSAELCKDMLDKVSEFMDTYKGKQFRIKGE